MKVFRALWLMLRGGTHLLSGWWVIRTQFPHMTQSQKQASVQRWAREFLAVWRIELEVHGQCLAQGPMLLVSNHISWLDILVLHAAGFCRFVAKSDVRTWPVIGMMATGAGTLYIERESRRDALRVVHHMRDALRCGEVVGVFPEGTTSDGLSVLPFHANLIQAAVAAPSPALPVALQFVDSRTRQISTAPMYIGDQTLVGSIWRTLTTPGIRAVVVYGQPQQPEGRDRRQWAVNLREAVDDLRAGASGQSSS